MDLTTLKSTAFWIALLSLIGIQAAHVAGSLPGKQAVLFSVVSAAAYVASRTVTKYRADFKRGFHTTEFWVGLGTVALAVAQSVQGNVSYVWLGGAIAAVSSLLTISRGLVNARATDLTE